MGVMACSRMHCDNIMCDTYIDGGIGYICHDCQSEFKEYFDKQNIVSITQGEIHRDLKMFMETTKGYSNGNSEMDVDAFFKLYQGDKQIKEQRLKIKTKKTKMDKLIEQYKQYLLKNIWVCNENELSESEVESMEIGLSTIRFFLEWQENIDN